MHELDGEALVFDPVSADTHRLNETALFIWRQCDGQRDAAQIACRLTESYDVSDEQARNCVDRVLDQLETCGLITATNGPQSVYEDPSPVQGRGQG